MRGVEEAPRRLAAACELYPWYVRVRLKPRAMRVPACGVFLAFCLLESRAHARDVAWEAPTGCPTAAQVTAAVERLLGRPLRVEEAGTATGEVLATSAGFRLRLRISRAGALRERQLEHADCRKLGDAAALLIALALDASLEASAPSMANEAAPPAHETKAAPALAMRPQPEPLDIAPPPHRMKAHHGGRVLTLGGASTLHWGVLPQPALGAGIAIGVRANSWWLSMNADFIGSASERVEGSAIARIDVTGWQGGLRGCYLLPNEDLSFGPCIGVAVGSLIAKGVEVEEPRTSTDRWSAGTAGIVVKMRLARSAVANLNLLVGADALLSVERPAFTVSGSSSVVRTSRLAEALSLGLFGEFGSF